MSSAETRTLQAELMMHDESKAKRSCGSLTAWPTSLQCHDGCISLVAVFVDSNMGRHIVTS